jgi:hypothetical protein
MWHLRHAFRNDFASRAPRNHDGANALRQRGPDDRKHSCCITHHQLGFDAHDAIAKPTPLLILAAVSCPAVTVSAAV